MSKHNKYRTNEEVLEILNQQLAVEQQKVATMPTTSKKKLRAKTDGQQDYFDAMNESTIIACLGPAGSGKTYMACGIAIEHLLARKVKTIIITRPIVECDEELGALPGTFEEKVSPHMQPFYDAFGDFLSRQEIDDLKKEGKLIMRPLAYMRGSTFRDSFIILDEAQNCTYKQIKLLLTRHGEGSKIVLCGDKTQSDIIGKRNKPSIRSDRTDFEYSCDLLEEIGDKEIEVIELTEADVVRSGLVRKIVKKFP